MVPPFAWETPGCPTTKHLRAVLPAGAMPTGQSLGHRFPFCVPWVIRPFILQPGKGLLSFVCLNPQGWGVKGLDGTKCEETGVECFLFPELLLFFPLLSMGNWALLLRTRGSRQWPSMCFGGQGRGEAVCKSLQILLSKSKL